MKTKSNRTIATTKDSNLRTAARRRGYILQKRRRTYCPSLNYGYSIREIRTGQTVAGENYDLTAIQVRDYLNTHEAL